MDPFNDPVFKALKDIEWPDTLEEVKTMAESVVSEWEWTKKAPETLDAIRSETSIDRIQKIVYNTCLAGMGMRVNYS